MSLDSAYFDDVEDLLFDVEGQIEFVLDSYPREWNFAVLREKLHKRYAIPE